MSRKNKLYVILVLGFVLLAVGTYLLFAYNNNIESDKTSKSQQDIVNTNIKQEFSYKGEDGKTALELLEQKADLDVSNEGFVNSIDGIAADSTKNEFWSFTVNGEMANEGAGTYITKSTETIDWKIETY